MSYRSSAPRLPLSPASPPDSGVKQQQKQHLPVTAPHTPPSPDHMSVAVKRYEPSYSNRGHTNEMESRSPEPYKAQAQRPSVSSSTPQQPVNNLKRPLPQDEEEKPSSKRQKKEETEEQIETQSSFTATNHDRLEDAKKSTVSFKDEPTTQDLPLPPKSSFAELDELFKDVGPALRTRRTTHRKSTIDMSQHLLGKYGLHDLLSSVARTDPQIGEKINKLRKSYEGQIKTAGLSGRNKPHKEERIAVPGIDDPQSRMKLLAIKDPKEFDATQHDTDPEHPQRVGDLDSNGFRDKMKSALRLNSGTMKKSTTVEWDDVLGHDPKRPGIQTVPSQPALHAQQQQRVPNGVRPVQQTAIPSAADKMRTRGKKRSYGDATFEGYHGFADGYSEGENDADDRDYADRANKRRKG